MTALLLCLLQGPSVVVAVGAPGTEAYGAQFATWEERWKQACEKAGAVHRTAETREDLEAALKQEEREAHEALWVVLIGHGTFDRRSAKFNLRGPDVSAAELAGWLKPFRRPVAVVVCSASSAPFIKALSGPGRVVITATKSGDEENFARFGEHLSTAIADPAADLDKDGQTSLLEAALTAAKRTARFYAGEGRLATEHALIDDNGDGFGTRADAFRGIRASFRPEGGGSADGYRAHQFLLIRSEAERRMPAKLRAERDRIELEIYSVRDGRTARPDAEYFKRLEALMVELAEVYERAEE